MYVYLWKGVVIDMEKMPPKIGKSTGLYAKQSRICKYVERHVTRINLLHCSRSCMKYHTWFFYSNYFASKL